MGTVEVKDQHPVVRNGVLIVAPPGPLRYGLRALLRSIPNVETVGVTGHTRTALQAICEGRPAVVLLDSALPGEGFLPLLKQLKARWPQLRCLVLVDGKEQQRQALLAEADAALLKGIPAARLSAAVEKLLTQTSQGEDGTTTGCGVGGQSLASQQVLDDAERDKGHGV